mmetsp:Transcript_7195/g.17602  ORF Transcript_7195/g.17602 Transcript_7195/m.17602 type:complete len:371 (+) Transcript_7195:26-1138(+)
MECCCNKLKERSLLMKSDEGTPGHFQAVAIDVGGEGRREHQDRPGSLLRLSEPLQRHNHRKGLLQLGWQAQLHLGRSDVDRLPARVVSGQPRLDEAEGNRIAADVVPTPLLCHGLCEAEDSRFCSRVVGLAGVSVDPRRGGDVQDDPRPRPPFLLHLALGQGAHVVARRLDELERHRAVNVQHRLPLLLRRLVDDTVPRVSSGRGNTKGREERASEAFGPAEKNPREKVGERERERVNERSEKTSNLRVVDDNVDSRKRPHGRLDQLFDDANLGQVAVDTDGFGAQLSHLVAHGLAHIPWGVLVSGEAAAAAASSRVSTVAVDFGPARPSLHTSVRSSSGLTCRDRSGPVWPRSVRKGGRLLFRCLGPLR